MRRQSEKAEARGELDETADDVVVFSEDGVDLQKGYQMSQLIGGPNCLLAAVIYPL